MSKLLIKPAKGSQVHSVTPQSAGWKYVGFNVHDLSVGESLECCQSGRELCLVVLTGSANISVGQQSWHNVGGLGDVYKRQVERIFLLISPRVQSMCRQEKLPTSSL